MTDEADYIARREALDLAVRASWPNDQVVTPQQYRLHQQQTVDLAWAFYDFLVNKDTRLAKTA